MGDNATTWPLLASGLVSGGFFSIFNFTCGILPLGQGAIPVRCPTPPSAAVRRVDGGSSFLFGNPFICGTLLVGKISSFGEGLFYRTAPTGYFVPRSVGAFFIGIGFASVNQCGEHSAHSTIPFGWTPIVTWARWGLFFPPLLAYQVLPFSTFES